jgi:hypothetical protein
MHSVLLNSRIEKDNLCLWDYSSIAVFEFVLQFDLKIAGVFLLSA